MTASIRPGVQDQGKAVVEKDGDGYLVMLPDGEVRRMATARDAERAAQEWFKDHYTDPTRIGVGMIEWRAPARPAGESK